MKDKKDRQDELSSLSPRLAKMKKDNPFEVPYNYFEKLPDDILQQWREEEQASQAKQSAPSWLDQLLDQLSVLLQPRTAIAFASLAVLIAAAVWMMQVGPEGANSMEVALAEPISDQEIEAYIEANLDEFDTELLFAESIAAVEESDAGEWEVDDADLDEYLDEIIDELDEEELEQLL
ncbi:MAG: hypothetical protein AAFV95_05980 [Bacteroidota bacterium]